MNLMFEWQEQYLDIVFPREHEIHSVEPTFSVLFNISLQVKTTEANRRHRCI